MPREVRRASKHTAEGLLLFLAMAGSELVGRGAAVVPPVGLARAGPAVGTRRWMTRREAVALALESLARDRGLEGPPAIVAGIPAAVAPERPCSRGSVAARVGCHLGRSTADIAVARTRRGWLVTVVLPELSDHVHRVTISTGARGAPVVEVESRN
jgi:hypothetical protein